MCIFARFFTILFQVPIFSQTEIPIQVKILFTFIVSYVLYPHLSSQIRDDLSFIGYHNHFLLFFYYTITGLMLGLFIKIIIDITTSAGNIMAQTIGLGSIKLFDPTFATQTGPIERLLYNFLIFSILSSGMMNPIFQGIYNSFSSFSLMKLNTNFYDYNIYLFFLKKIISSTFLVSLPIASLNIITNIVLGIMSRLIPQLNVLMLSFSINIIMGLILLFIYNNEIIYFIHQFYIEMIGYWYLMVS